uniref:Very-long-chain (3R)-3-hydroxyacyl-CoA dehydratase n=1 Tax=Heterorhabditis bacteriophora TaxID=37862 RepID=A0A1I7X8T9_HETBA
MELSQRSTVLKLYIFLYNIILFLLHLFLIVDIANEHVKGTFVYNIHFPLLRLGTALQIFDILHSIAKFTKTNVSSGLIQVFGRLCMLYVIQGNPEIHSHLTTSILLFVWILIEIFSSKINIYQLFKVIYFVILDKNKYSAFVEIYIIYSHYCLIERRNRSSV